MRPLSAVLLLGGVLAGCASAGARSTQSPAPAQAAPRAASQDTTSADRAQYPSTYQRHPNAPVLIRNATIMTATGQEIAGGSILFRDGRIVAVGTTVEAPADAVVVDGTGKWVTPGIIDSHSHLGVYAAPGTQAESDGNEATNPVTAEVWAEHSFWPQDPQIPLAIAGGVTTIQALPGSANLIGGRSAVLKLIPARSVQEMKFPGARYGLKMACGENPKRVYQSRGPSTRMGNMAGYRAAFIQAEQYRWRWDKWNADHQGDPPQRDLKLESLAEVLRGNILVQNHCYRADEMAIMIDIAKEFGYKIAAFHHGSEAYKIADILAKEDICAATWAGWWGFKMESIDGIEENAALVHAAGGCVVIHSDDPILAQRLNQEAAAALSAGRRLGIDISEADAIKWITANPAKMMGILDKTGTLEAGKMADVVIWSADPFSIYAVADSVFIDGALIYDRHDKRYQPKSDFLLGHPAGESK